jgi:hypothetical protein
MVGWLGCGNGKYMNINNGVAMVGLDHSMELAKICAGLGYEVRCVLVLCLVLLQVISSRVDTLSLPYGFWIGCTDGARRPTETFFTFPFGRALRM